MFESSNCNHKSLETLCISNNIIRDSISYLSNSLEDQSSIRSLSLSQNSMTNEDIKTLTISLAKNTTITSLDISNNLLRYESDF